MKVKFALLLLGRVQLFVAQNIQTSVLYFVLTKMPQAAKHAQEKQFNENFQIIVL